jgi:hypothetical protein
MSNPSCLGDLRDLVGHFDKIESSKESNELHKFIGDLGASVNLDNMLEMHPDCTVDRVEQERKLLISHAFANRYLLGERANPEQSKSFHKFLCPLCLKLIFRCVTTVCGHSFCEVCLDEYLLIKQVSQLLLLQFQSCFVCDFSGEKRTTIRNKPTFASFAIDDMNAQLVDKCGDTALQAMWQE